MEASKTGTPTGMTPAILTRSVSSMYPVLTTCPKRFVSSSVIAAPCSLPRANRTLSALTANPVGKGVPKNDGLRPSMLISPSARRQPIGLPLSSIISPA